MPRSHNPLHLGRAARERTSRRSRRWLCGASLASRLADLVQSILLHHGIFRPRDLHWQGGDLSLLYAAR